MEPDPTKELILSYEKQIESSNRLIKLYEERALVNDALEKGYQQQVELLKQMVELLEKKNP